MKVKNKFRMFHLMCCTKHVESFVDFVILYKKVGTLLQEEGIRVHIGLIHNVTNDGLQRWKLLSTVHRMNNFISQLIFTLTRLFFYSRECQIQRFRLIPGLMIELNRPAEIRWLHSFEILCSICLLTGGCFEAQRPQLVHQVVGDTHTDSMAVCASSGEKFNCFKKFTIVL